MKETKATSFILIFMLAMGMTVFPAHAQVKKFDILCFLQCAGTCVSSPIPKLLCISTCITTCYRPAPAPLPPAPMPPAPPKPPNMLAFPPQASLEMKSCKTARVCSVQECDAINTDTEKLKCLENCSKVACGS